MAESEPTRRHNQRKLYNERTRQILQEFCDTTTAHGWGHMIRTASTPLKLLWVVLTLFALVVNMIHVSALVLQYLSWPYEQVSHVEVKEIVFPSVTVCNIQPVSPTAVAELLSNTSSKFYQWNNATNHFLQEMRQLTNDTVAYRMLYDRLRGPRGFYENIGDEVTFLGHQSHDFILGCVYAFEPCSVREFIYHRSSTYYNCFTFNGGNASREKLTAKMSGPQAGLSLVFYMENDIGDSFHTGPYYTFLTVGNAAGVRVVTHAPDTWPSELDHGLDIPPGYSSTIGLKVLKYSRLGRPYAHCQSDTQSQYSHYRYSAHECLMSCEQRYIMDTCNCVTASLAQPEDAQNSLSYCSFYNKSDPADLFTRTECERNGILEFLTNHSLRESCICNAPCEEYIYDADMSYSYWPIDSSQQSFYDVYVNQSEMRDSLKAYNNFKAFNMTKIVERGLIRKNFARLNIYLESLMIQEYVQKGSYTIYNLISDVGGTFGLWVGMSVLTWGEVVELCSRLFVRWCFKMIHGIAAVRDLRENENEQNSSV